MKIRVTYKNHPVFKIDNPDEIVWRVPPGEDASKYLMNETDVKDWHRRHRIEGVRREAQRRIMALLEARDRRHLDVLLSNNARESIRLLRKGYDNCSTEEKLRAAELEKIDIALEAIRTSSNKMEQNPSRHYCDDKYWP
ncbi:MAG: hypothetical protein L3J32_11095 [Rhizobiaceae bacterium]|nr:hypothetical protein [Rhizobiaceae bacterium]